MQLNSVGINPIIYTDLQDSKAIHNSSNKDIKDSVWKISLNQLQKLAFKLYSVALECFQKMKSFGVKIGHQIRVAVIYIDRAVVFNIQIGGVHHHYPESRREVQPLQPMEIKKGELQKCEEKSAKESTLVEAKETNLLYKKSKFQPFLALSHTPKSLF